MLPWGYAWIKIIKTTLCKNICSKQDFYEGFIFNEPMIKNFLVKFLADFQ